MTFSELQQQPITDTSRSGHYWRHAMHIIARMVTHLLNILRGALIGSAELVPGVSGGTVALIVGIYERALHNANLLLKAKFREVEWIFLLTIGVGMFAAVFGLSGILSSFVEGTPDVARALFFGMVAVSIIVPLMMIDEDLSKKKGPAIITFLIAAGLVAFVTGFTSEPNRDPSLIAVFFAAAIAVCALVLPGVSGSLILLTLGLYNFVIGSVSDRDLTVLAVFAAGALTGLVAFVKVINYLLDQHRTLTLVAMAGLMVGSLRAIWPWQGDGDANFLTLILMMLLGAVIVAAFVIADRTQAKKKAQV